MVRCKLTKRTKSKSHTSNLAKMKALALNSTGTSMMEIEIAKPKPGDNEVLIQVIYSALDTSFANIAKRDMISSYIHDIKVEPLVAGYHFSGIVAAKGSSVSSFQVDDRVFGHLQYEPTQRQGSFCEYIVMGENDIALVPTKHVSMEKAAASTTEALTALQSVRDLGRLRKGQSILIIGAGGGVGSAAVGIAGALGANVTAVCSTKDVKRVQRMGADTIIDRSTQDIKKLKEKYDIVFDVPSRYSFFIQGMKWLKPGGAFINTLPGLEKLVFGWLWPLITSKRLETVLVTSKKKDLELIGNMMVNDQVPVDIDSIYKIKDFSQAWKRLDDGKKIGRVVIQVQDGW